jgi:hypothetical protein
MMFKKAERKQSRLRLCIAGASGSGKTYAALTTAFSIGEKVAVIDTENGSASLYSHLGDFDVLELTAPYHPDSFIAAIKAAEKSGYDVLVIDSATHEWQGSGGCLEINDLLAQTKYRNNSYAAWNETSKLHRSFLDAMLQTKMHIICTVRSKTETVQSESITGKKTIQKLGMKAEQRDGFEYEFTVVLDLTHDGHLATVSKDRTGLFADKAPQKITTETGLMLKDWLILGIEPPNYFLEISKCQTLDELKDVWMSMPVSDRAQYEHIKNEQKELILTNENENKMELANG